MVFKQGRWKYPVILSKYLGDKIKMKFNQIYELSSEDRYGLAFGKLAVRAAYAHG